MRAQRLAIYLLPAVLDAQLAMVLFVCAVRAAHMGGSALEVSGILTAWGLVYALASPLVGRMVTPANAARLMTLAALGCVVLCVLLMFTNSIPAMIALVGVCGVFASMFFTPFQVFMRSVDADGGKSPMYSAGLYTFSWSMGFAVGPLIGGLLMEVKGGPLQGWQWAYVFGAITAAVTAIGVMALRHLATAAPASEPEQSPLSESEPNGRPDFAWLAWVVCGLGVGVLSLVRGVFPSRAVTALHLADSIQGTFFFLLSLAQAFTALWLVRGRTWMYRPGPLTAFGLVGVAGAAGFGWCVHPFALYASAIAFGVYCGSMFFFLVFHAIVNPARSGRNVARNEMIVGLAGILGPLAGGLIGNAVGPSAPFACGAALLVAVCVFQAVVLMRARNDGRKVSGEGGALNSLHTFTRSPFVPSPPSNDQ